MIALLAVCETVELKSVELLKLFHGSLLKFVIVSEGFKKNLKTDLFMKLEGVVMNEMPWQQTTKNPHENQTQTEGGVQQECSLACFRGNR
jgi:hypothetical protein